MSTTAHSDDAEAPHNDGGEPIGKTKKESTTATGKYILGLTLAVLTCAVIALAISLALLVDKDECDARKTYSVTLQVDKNGPEIEVTDTRSVWVDGSSSVTWRQELYEGWQSTLLASNGGNGWFDRAVKVRNVDTTASFMDLTVYFHTEKVLANILEDVVGVDFSDPICSRSTISHDLYSLLIDDNSEGRAAENMSSGEFDLGTCEVTRLDDGQQGPRELSFSFTGTVYAESD